MNPKIPFVGARFSPDAFRRYVSQLKFTEFRPEFVTVHHTAVPSLAQRPNGFSSDHLQNLRAFFEREKGWSGAPHVFLDDQPEGIIVFQRLDRRGVHAASFNARSWGVEMLGNYDTESFTTGRGAAIRELAIETVALMCQRLGVSASTVRFHRDDPKTTKSCPGTGVSKPDFVYAVATRMETWRLFLPNGTEFPELRMRNGRALVPARQLLDALFPGAVDLRLNPLSGTVCARGKMKFELGVYDLDFQGRAWMSLRELANKTGLEIQTPAPRVLKLVRA